MIALSAVRAPEFPPWGFTEYKFTLPTADSNTVR